MFNSIRLPFLLFLFVGSYVFPLSASPSGKPFWGWFCKKEEVKKDSVTTSVSKYQEIVDSATESTKGVFGVFEKKGVFYFEIPDSLFGRDFLVTNKLMKVPSELNEAGVNRGINYENNLIAFELDKTRKKIMVRQQRPLPLFADHAALAGSIKDNYISPLIAGFPIEAVKKDSTTYLIKVNDIYNGTETSINNVFSSVNLGTSAIKNLSRIKLIKAFKNNVSAVSELTTKVTEGNSSVHVTVEVNSSLVLLPQKPMQGRLSNPKVGYFTSNRLSFENENQAADYKRYITRWRLEPTDKAAYLRGELVEPQKPILFYIDKSTPSKWRSYITQGMLEWNIAFEKAGFKNAIQVYQETDSMQLDQDDASYSVFTYAASEKQNAMGPSVVDPRTGEIIEADIVWWHNVINMLKEWLVVQTGVYDPAAKHIELPDSLLGDAIRFVACHEVGHSLGLRHNMMGSWTYPTDSLRSVTFTDKMHSTSSSIMDYARFNYVAQPGDNIKVKSPHIGPYDIFAIEYGYRWYGDNISEKEEMARLHQMLLKHNTPLYKYSEAQDTRDAVDPRALSEDLGDDALLSARYGIANLKRIVPNIIAWTTLKNTQGQSYREASSLYRSVINQWNNYLYHVLANVGGIYLENTTVGDGVKTYTFVEKERQKQAVRFLLDEALTYPEWLFGADIQNYTYIQKKTPLGMVETAPQQLLSTAQAYIFWDLLLNNRMLRMLANEQQNGDKAFTVIEMMDMLHKHLFGVTEAGKNPDLMTRNLQKGFVDALLTAAGEAEAVKSTKKLTDLTYSHPLLAHPDCGLGCCNVHDNGRSAGPRKLDFYGTQINRISDVISIKRGALLRIKELLIKRRTGASTATKYHYNDIVLRINSALGM